MSYILEVKFLHGRVIILCHWVIKQMTLVNSNPGCGTLEVLLGRLKGA